MEIVILIFSGILGFLFGAFTGSGYYHLIGKRLAEYGWGYEVLGLIVFIILLIVWLFYL